VTSVTAGTLRSSSVDGCAVCADLIGAGSLGAGIDIPRKKNVKRGSEKIVGGGAGDKKERGNL
jgi:hypothetical protein